MAARELSCAGMQVTLLEARKRLGGRILTYSDNGFSKPVEGGAEFVHGKLDVTKKLLKEFRLKTYAAKGSVWHVREEGVEKDKNFVDEHHRRLAKKLQSLKRDTTAYQFLQKHFNGAEYAELRQSVKGFVEGYESATIHSFSAKAFLEDWQQTEQWEQFRIEGGYGLLIDALAEECRSNGCIIRVNSIAGSIRWEKGHIAVKCSNGKIYSGHKLVVAVPLSILQHRSIRFYPALQEKKDIWKQLGYGDVIKIMLEFKEPFWKDMSIDGQSLKKLFFFFSQQPVPTWWTQYPSPDAILCGWLSGPQAKKFSSKTDRQLLNDAMDSLQYIFQKEEQELTHNLKAGKVFNWTKDPFTSGSYSYAVVNGKKLSERARKPVDNTLFFAGEHLSEPIGTVESALKSGEETARRILTGRFGGKR